MSGMIEMLAQVGCEEVYNEALYEAEQEVNDPYACVNSCDALRIIDGVIPDPAEEIKDARGLSECMVDVYEIEFLWLT